MSTAEWPRPSETAPVRQTKSKRRNTRSSSGKLQQAQPEDRSTELPSPLAGFVGLEVRAIDAEKWPVAPVIWWEPTLSLPLPNSSGLRNERGFRVPLAGFFDVEQAPHSRPSELARPEDGVRFEFPPAAAVSDLEPLGWNPLSARDGNPQPHRAPLGEKE
jgi:hypothetical protein